MYLNKSKNKTKNFLSTILKRYLNKNCTSSLKLNILKDIDEFSPILSRILGIPTQIEFYDTHRLNKNIKFLQSSFKTVLILPGTVTNYKVYENLIDNLFEKFNYRFLALNFPGFYFVHPIKVFFFT